MSQTAWVEAFIKAQGEFPAIGKETTVNTGSYSYRYATLPDILEKVSDVLRNYGLLVVQSVGGTAESVSVETRIYHKEGHVETFGPLSLNSGRDAQAAGSAITYARRYALCAALGIAPDEDDDGERASRSQTVVRNGNGDVLDVIESEADAAWRWLWGETKIFKAWSDSDRMAAIESALAFLKLPAVEDRVAAERIFAHLVDEYAKRPMETQEALPVEN